MAGERDPRMQPAGSDEVSYDESMAAALRAAGNEQLPPIVFRGSRPVGVLQAHLDTEGTERAVLNAATIDAAIETGQPVVIGIGSEFTGLFTPIDVLEATRRAREADPAWAAQLQADMQLPPQQG